MALLNCKKCGTYIDDDEIRCPKCGIESPFKKRPHGCLIIIGILFALGFLGQLINLDTKTAVVATETQGEVSKQELEQLIAELPVKANWRAIDINNAKNAAYSLTLHYKGNVSAYEAAADTKLIIRKILAYFMQQGFEPSEKIFTLSVHADRDDLRGETGKPLFQDLGMSTYRTHRDQIEYIPPGKIFGP
jgi:DNA-directed RNA polymerase subunit RPC12/RpoP